ncbi:MAG TPA: YggT family protein [Dehalococcoidia bacterium]|nr:YggT family protein [Dehalococcoidia bacterium]
MLLVLAQAANWVLSLLFWLLVGRLVLDFLVGVAGSSNPVAILLHRLTDPLLQGVRRVTPAAIGDRAIPPLALISLVVLRLLLMPLLLS